MIARFGKWWRKRMRRTDMEILWPACVEQAADIDLAKAVFATHAFNDPAWMKDYTDAQLTEFIDNLGLLEIPDPPSGNNREPVR